MAALCKIEPPARLMLHACKREKRFTDGRQRPIDRNDRARLLFIAKAARRRGELTRAEMAAAVPLSHRHTSGNRKRSSIGR